MKKAILFGGTGFVGSFILSELLRDSHYEEVTVITRRNIDVHDPKLKIVIGDYNSLTQLTGHFNVNDIFIALGTTKSATPNLDKYYEIDHDYPLLAASIAKQHGAKSVFLVSSVGANPDSRVFYIRTKGEIERDIIALDFENTHIFRPSMILGDRKQNRPLESIMKKLWGAINPLLIGRLSRYKGISGKNIATAMVRAASDNGNKVKVYHWKEMVEV